MSNSFDYTINLDVESNTIITLDSLINNYIENKEISKLLRELKETLLISRVKEYYLSRLNYSFIKTLG